MGNYHPTGMSDTTRKGYKYDTGGVEGSRKAASDDMSKYNKFQSQFAEAERETGMPKALIGAIASRESRIGGALPANGYGCDGHGYGIMQVDDRHHNVDKSGGPASLSNILQGARILKESISEVEKKHPNWTKEQQVQGGVAAYNFGSKNVQTVAGIDKGTTGNDYSNDVMARAKHYNEKSQ